jgi:2-methylisocitrate lyase-like PEP mutase family enzyme
MEASLSPGARLRQRIAQNRILVAPGAYDALTARMVEHAGFDAVYFTGAGLHYTSLASPDFGLLSMTEMVDRARQIVEAVSVPVIADIDNGYGGVLNVARAIRAYESAGVAGVHMEDQSFPKRCGLLAGKTLVSTEEMVQKIRAAREARRDPGFVIMARCDAFILHGLDELIERGRAYLEAGADVLFVEAAGTSAEDLAAVGRAVDAPLITDMVEGSNSPWLSAGELEAMGYDIVIFPNSLTRMFARLGLDLLQTLKESGTTTAWHDRMFSFSQLLDLLGLERIMEFERRTTEGPVQTGGEAR